MVFSSVPVYLDPHNWQQQQQNHQQGVVSENPHEFSLLPPPPPQIDGGGGGSGSIRPGSMADQARLAKLPQPEPGLKCPRCESTNTKFCYFNNYSLTQPRHFCKTCRRYWTRGGALRNVPVGGGCRRNKRSKKSSSNSPVGTGRQRGGCGPPNNNYNSTSAIHPSSCSTAEILSGHFPLSMPQLPLMGTSNLQSLTHHEYVTTASGGNIGLNFDGKIQAQMASPIDHAIFSSGGIQHFPFLANFEVPPTSLYQFQSEGGVEAQSSGNITQSTPVKMEENRGLNLSKQFLGISENNQYWGTTTTTTGNTWTTDFSGLNSSSSTSNLL